MGGPRRTDERPAIVTVGHGTLESRAFADLVREAGIGLVVDVRRFPGSRRHPHFAREAMGRWLPEAGVDYRWTEALGGRRKGVPDSPNVGLRNLQFRAYADHMASPEFEAALRRVVETADETPLAVMCSEAVWWRCHRRLVADHLVLVEGLAVEHLFHDGRLTDHPVTPGARRSGSTVVYDAPPDDAPSE